MSRKGKITVGDVWARDNPQGDEYDRVRVVGLVDHAGREPDEYTIISDTAEFGAVIQTDAAGLLDFCKLVSSGDPEQERWETQHV
jgi:hypothetical protein